ncbi:DsbA family oxidoreductase [Rhizohabitans arisaemae]|uniref:DsbA family oxidoreductase n=1 Tax=Rhizohabitans arisaemae TaxID=2720610 RepID=UPI0024B0B4CC|nr:DsbA family oxidoreductase [Rhizohabitans arisaemae]
MKIEIWSDIVCPWCYIGKRRLEQALDRFEHAAEVELEWRSFQLDPSAPVGVAEPVLRMLAEKRGMGETAARAALDRVTAIGAELGLAIDFDRALAVNTFDAHRLLHLAKSAGLSDAAWERMMKAYFTEGADLSDRGTLVRLVGEAGVPIEEAERVLAGDDYRAEVQADLRAAVELGASGVPFFVVERRYGISGAQPVETFLDALRRAHADRAAV